MLYDYDFINKIVDIPAGTTDVLVLDLINDIRDAEATAQGICYGQIASASGSESLGGGVSVGITVNLLDDWQVRFSTGNYIAKIFGGNLVGGLDGDPVAYSSGVQVLLLQSAASTVVQVSTGSGLSTEEHDKLMGVPTAAGTASAVWEDTTGAAVATRLAEAWGRLGLDPSAPLATGTTSISFGDIVMAMTGDATSTTVTRQ